MAPTCRVPVIEAGSLLPTPFTPGLEGGKLKSIRPYDEATGVGQGGREGDADGWLVKAGGDQLP